jgi:hypothetical protein
MNSRRLIASPEAQDGAAYSVKREDWKGWGEDIRCPLRVISGHFAVQSACPLYPRKRTFADVN